MVIPRLASLRDEKAVAETPNEVFVRYFTENEL